MYALNRLTLDEVRFANLIRRITKTDERVYHHLLNKIKYEGKTKAKSIKRDKRSDGSISGYKFMLRPINGKDISSIEKEL